MRRLIPTGVVPRLLVLAQAPALLVEVVGPRLSSSRRRVPELAARLDEQAGTGFDESVRNRRAHRAARREGRNGR